MGGGTGGTCPPPKIAAPYIFKAASLIRTIHVHPECPPNQIMFLHQCLENLASSMQSARLHHNYNYEAFIRLCSGIYMYTHFVSTHVLGSPKFYAAAVNMPRCISMQVQ